MKRFFVALTLLTALSICLHSGYAQQNENEELDFIGMPVDQRTAAVADAIVAAVPGADAAADVTTEHLAAITELTITSSTPLSLNEGDFDSLTGLTTLDLSDNQIDSLSTDGPEAIFARLESLTTLDLSAIPYHPCQRVSLTISPRSQHLTCPIIQSIPCQTVSLTISPRSQHLL